MKKDLPCSRFPKLVNIAGADRLLQFGAAIFMMNSNESISKAVAIFRSSPNAPDIEVHDALVAAGLPAQIAARIVEFLPMVYCRLVLASRGVKFADTFRRKLAEGELSAHKPLSSEPLWEACVGFADREVKNGATGEDLLVIAARSAEFEAVNRLLQGGSKLEHVALTSAVLVWPEHGPLRE